MVKEAAKKAKKAAKEAAKEAKEAKQAAKEAKKANAQENRISTSHSITLYCDNKHKSFSFPPSTVMSTVLSQMLTCLKRKTPGMKYSIVLTSNYDIALPLTRTLYSLNIKSGDHLTGMHFLLGMYF